MNQMLPIVLIIGLLGLLFAIMLRLHAIKQDPGNQKMREIADAIAEGVGALLTSEYRMLIVFVALLFIVIGFGISSWATAGRFLVGSFFSTTADYLGMGAAIRADCRVADATRTSGMYSALALAFPGDSVMGMAVVGLGLTGVEVLYMTTRDASALSGLSLGASSIVLSARVGGGIYTKAADVGANLVGRVEAGILEDNPHNPAVTTGNVGDSVGDVAGTGADLFESYVGSLISTLTLGLVFYQESGIIFPPLLSVCGITASIIETLLVKAIGDTGLHKALRTGEYSAAALVVIVVLALSRTFFGSYLTALTVITGLFVGVLIGFVTEIYTSGGYRFIKEVASQSETSPATTIISGLAVGMQSTVVPVFLVCIGTLVSNRLTGFYGIVPAVVGMLLTTRITVAIDAYGSIADSAEGIAGMAGLDKSIRKITDKLDSMGNTMVAIDKGFTIGSVALTALALFVSHAETVKLTTVSILNAHVIMDLFVGRMLTFLFSAMTMKFVSKAARQVTEEARRQFRENPQIFQGNVRPDYASCVFISTTAAFREILLSGSMAVLALLATGIILGPSTPGGLLTDSLVIGILTVIFTSNSGGAWDSAKKYIGGGNRGGKGNTAHKAAVVGDAVGGPSKDTSEPSIDTLIKPTTTVFLVFAPLFLQYGGLIQVNDTHTE